MTCHAIKSMTITKHRILSSERLDSIYYIYFSYKGEIIYIDNQFK